MTAGFTAHFQFVVLVVYGEIVLAAEVAQIHGLERKRLADYPILVNDRFVVKDFSGGNQKAGEHTFLEATHLPVNLQHLGRGSGECLQGGRFA